MRQPCKGETIVPQSWNGKKATRIRFNPLIFHIFFQIDLYSFPPMQA